MPELDLNFDFSAFDMLIEMFGRSSLMSPPFLVSSRSSQQAQEEEDDDEEPALVLASGNTSPKAGLSGLDPSLSTRFGSIARSESRAAGPSILDEETGILDVGWEFDENGNMIETTPAPKPASAIRPAESVPTVRVEMGSTISAGVRQEHAEALHATQQVNLFFGTTAARHYIL